MMWLGKILAITMAVIHVAISVIDPGSELVYPPPVIKFDTEQREMVDDMSPVVVVNWHRQKGKDYTAAAKAVRSALLSGQDWFIISLTQRQADATFAKCKRAARAVMEYMRLQGREFDSDAREGEGFVSEQYDKWIKHEFRFMARELHLPGGGRVISLPGRDPDTLAGLTGNIILTEFGLFPGGGYDHWRVVFPLTTRGYQCVVISTPRGKNSKFYELWKNEDNDKETSVHTCSIWQSVKSGWSPDGPGGKQWTDADVEALKRRYRDAAGWLREYECEFSGDALALVSWAEIERAAGLSVPTNRRGVQIECRYARFDKAEFGDHATEIVELLSLVRGERLAIGWDVARTSDLSAVTVNVLREGQPSHLAVVVAMHDCEFGFQRSVVTAFMDLSPQNVGYGDSTGLGMDSNETLFKRYRFGSADDGRWVAHTFTPVGKAEVASALKTAFSDGTQTIPPLNTELKLIATDVYAIQRDNTGARVVISETENPLLDESHCDIAYSLGLAILAGSRAVIIPLPIGNERKPVGL